MAREPRGARQTSHGEPLWAREAVEMGKLVRVALVDADPALRARLREALEGDGCQVCCEGASTAAAVALVEMGHPDVVLLDESAPGDPLAAIGCIAATAPDVAVLLLSSSCHGRRMIEALRAGAQGYLVKDHDLPGVARAVRATRHGEPALSRELVGRLVRELRERETTHRRLHDGPAGRLTQREWEVLDLLAGGASTAEIARKLVVEPVTVRSYVSSILHKLHVCDRKEAVRAVADDRPSRATSPGAD